MNTYNLINQSLNSNAFLRQMGAQRRNVFNSSFCSQKMTIWAYIIQPFDMCMLEGGPMWDHARRWGVGKSAGSGGGRLGIFDLRYYIPDFVPSFYTLVRILSRQTSSVAELSILSTQTFRVAGLVILSTQKFGVLVLRK